MGSSGITLRSQVKGAAQVITSAEHRLPDWKLAQASLPQGDPAFSALIWFVRMMRE